MGGRRAGAREVKKEKSDRERERESGVDREKDTGGGVGGQRRQGGQPGRKRELLLLHLCVFHE